MGDLLGSNSLEELRVSIDVRRRNIDTLTLQSKLAAVATELLERGEDGISVSCPICGDDHDRKELQLALQKASDTRRGQALTELQKTEKTLQEAERIANDIEESEQDIEQRERELSAALVDIDGMYDQDVGGVDEESMNREVARVVE